eukprot:7134353-Prymnesium_polylepis.1
MTPRAASSGPRPPRPWRHSSTCRTTAPARAGCLRSRARVRCRDANLGCWDSQPLNPTAGVPIPVRQPSWAARIGSA